MPSRLENLDMNQAPSGRSSRASGEGGSLRFWGIMALVEILAITALFAIVRGGRFSWYDFNTALLIVALANSSILRTLRHGGRSRASVIATIEGIAAGMLFMAKLDRYQRFAAVAALVFFLLVTSTFLPFWSERNKS